ncbi:MAG: NAD(+)/NADH kinase [Firmicutes bacterium]|nr:NAD(+)/NADH kinase [Bacillota bacterium]
MRFSIVDRGDTYSTRITARIIEELTNNGWIFDSNKPEIVICVGGDGTILRAIHDNIHVNPNPMYVGIHTGTLGFLTDYGKDELPEFIDDLIHSKPMIKTNKMLEVTFPEKGETIYALNEVRLESLGKSLKLDVYIDGEFFETTNGSGVCVSTQAGSTAVNRALSGAVVDSELNIMQFCEIMPLSHMKHHSLRNPYIMNENRYVTIKGESLAYVNAYYDHLAKSLEGITVIEIKTSQKKVRFARYRTYSYLKRLKNLY